MKKLLLKSYIFEEFLNEQKQGFAFFNTKKCVQPLVDLLQNERENEVDDFEVAKIISSRAYYYSNSPEVYSLVRKLVSAMNIDLDIWHLFSERRVMFTQNSESNPELTQAIFEQMQFCSTAKYPQILGDLFNPEEENKVFPMLTM